VPRSPHAFALTLACLAVAVRGTAAAAPAPQEAYRAVAEGGGLRCVPAAGGSGGMTTYRVADLGKPGVPRLTVTESSTVRRISAKVRSRTLRFTVLRDRVDPRLPALVVFDAKLGVCPTIPGYGVLNGPCNLFFAPAREQPLAAAPDCIGHDAPM
jgi:hypothetical protein